MDKAGSAISIPARCCHPSNMVSRLHNAMHKPAQLAGRVCRNSRSRRPGILLINAYRQIPPLESSIWCRANGAEDASLGQRPRYSARSRTVRPERAEGSCALSGRQRIRRCRNPGRCSGLTCGGGFSAARCIFIFLNLQTLTPHTVPFPLRPGIYEMPSTHDCTDEDCDARTSQRRDEYSLWLALAAIDGGRNSDQAQKPIREMALRRETGGERDIRNR